MKLTMQYKPRNYVDNISELAETHKPNGAKEIREAYLRLYNFDYAKACCNQNDFDFSSLD